jgi:hypothetical protein
LLLVRRRGSTSINLQLSCVPILYPHFLCLEDFSVWQHPSVFHCVPRTNYVFFSVVLLLDRSSF